MIRLPILMLALLIICSTFAQQPDIVQQIDRQCSLIRTSLAHLQRDSIDIMDMSADGGTATAFKDSVGKVILIRLDLFGESGNLFEQYYYSNSRLIFVRSEDHRFNSPYYIDSTEARQIGGQPFDPSKTKISTDLYYLDGDRLYFWRNPRGNLIREGSEFKEGEKRLRETSRKLLQRFGRKT